MATPKQIATLLGLCAVSFGLFYASSLAEDQPIVLWGESAETTIAQQPGTDAPAEGTLPAAESAPPAAQKPADHGTAKQTKPAPAAAKPAAKASTAPATKPADAKPAAAKPSAAPVKTAAKPEQKPAAAKPSAAPVKTAAKPAAPAKPAATPTVAAATPTVAAATPVPAKPAAVAVQPAAPASGAVNAPPMNPRGGRIPASTPERLAAMAKQSAGRVDPFVSLELPAASTSSTPAQTTKIPVPPGPGKGSLPRPTATPMPTPGDGMVVTGIITSAKESVAIVAADGRSRLVQVGDFLPGGIRVVSINPQGKAVIVSHGGRSARLAVKE